MKRLGLAILVGGAMALSACEEYSGPVNHVPNTYVVGDSDGSPDYQQAVDVCHGSGFKEVQSIGNDDGHVWVVTCNDNN